MMALLSDYLADAMASDFFAGGLALGVLGALVAMLRLVLGVLWRAVRRRVWVSLTLDNRSASYRHLCLWMEHNEVLKHARSLRMTDTRWAAGTKGYAPAPGRHWFWWQARPGYLSRHISDKTKVGGAHDQRPMEELSISLLFGRLETLLGWIAEGRDLARMRVRIGPGLHVLRGDYWESLGDIPRRPLSTVLCDDDRIDALLSDMRWFYGARDWYAARGVPWRRGYLLYGPPGTGKSSVIRALASEVSVDIASLEIGRATLTDDDLREAMICAPKGALIAIEDVDAAFTQRQSGEKRSGVSFSGLLNAIDGVAAQEGRVVIMTTNHRDRLDPALIRPGRADLHVELGWVQARTARVLFERFFPEEPALALRFQNQLGDGRFSPAVLQGWLLENCKSPERAAEAYGLRRPPPALAGE